MTGKGHPIGVVGLIQLYGVVTQLRDEAGERQLKEAEIGMELKEVATDSGISYKF